MPLVNPHGGGDLRPLLLQGDLLAAERRRAVTLPKLTVSSREKGDIVMLGIGGFTPLEGFMTHADWQGVCDGMNTASGLFWPIPITLSAEQAFVDSIRTGQEIALVDPDDGQPLATMMVTEKYAINKAHECATIFRTTDPEHPGVKMVLGQPEVNLAGPIKVLSTGGFAEQYGALFMTPAADTRAVHVARLVEDRGVPDAQPDAPLARVSRQDRDRGLRRRPRAFAAGSAQARRHPGRGAHPGDRHAGRQVFRGQDRRAGRLSARHALCRVRARRCCTRCSGRTTAARTRSSVAITPASAAITARSTRTTSSIRFRRARSRRSRSRSTWTFWCYKCGGMASGRTCPHDDADRLLVSGTKLRKSLSEGSEVPPEFSRPEVLAILREYYAGLDASQKSRSSSPVIRRGREKS